MLPPSSLVFSSGMGAERSFTARIERPLFHRGGSANKKDTWPLLPPLFSPSRDAMMGDVAQSEGGTHTFTRSSCP